MVRLRMKHAITLMVVSFVLCLFVIFLLHHRLSRPYYRGVPDVDPELWKLLGPQKETTKKPATKAVSQIHIKQLPSIFLSANWSIQKTEETFFSFLENKDVRCEADVRLGNWNEGGWNVCMTPPYKLTQPCIVFSFGIGNDWQFDDSLSNRYGCRVLAFDPSIQEPSVHRNSLIEFRKVGLGARNEVTKKGWRLKTLGQHLKDEGYWEVPVDYLKIDIEYMEWQVLKEAFRDDSLKYIKQLGFEIHTPELYRIFQLGKTMPERDAASERLDFVHMFETLHQVEILGFKKFNYRRNPFGNYKSPYSQKDRSCCYELHYINTDFLEANHTVIHTEDSKLFHR